MLDFSHIPKDRMDIQVFTGTCTTTAEHWVTWTKPRGKSMCSILLVGKGGNGGSGSIGATAAGGGGGSSGTQVSLTMPLYVLPDTLYLALIGQTATASLISYISTQPSTVANNVVAIGRGGANGGNASAGTAGTAGGAPTIPQVTEMAFAWQFINLALAGQAGAAGGGNAAPGGNVTLPTTGLIVTGGAGGGGSDFGAATAGFAGGSLTVPAQPSAYLAHPGGIGGSSASTPPTRGNAGYQPIKGLLMFYGGTGGGSPYNLATGAALIQTNGGNGANGCGGGGSSAALTGSTPGVAGLGGSAFAIITCW